MKTSYLVVIWSPVTQSWFTNSKYDDPEKAKQQLAYIRATAGGTSRIVEVQEKFIVHSEASKAMTTMEHEVRNLVYLFGHLSANQVEEIRKILLPSQPCEDSASPCDTQAEAPQRNRGMNWMNCLICGMTVFSEISDSKTCLRCLLDKSEAEAADLRDKLRDKARTLASVRADLEDSRKQCLDLKTGLDALADTNGELRRDLKTIRSNLTDSETTLKYSRETIETLQKNLGKSMSEVSAKDREILRLKAKLLSLKESLMEA